MVSGTEKTLLFRYKKGNTFLHKMPPALKIILMLCLSIGAFYCPPFLAILLWTFLIIFSCTVLGFRIIEVFTDVKPILFYALLIYISSFIVNILTINDKKNILLLFLPSFSLIKLLLKMALSLQITSVFYRTTSNIQFLEGFRTIEQKITKNEDTPFANTISLCITFIPSIALFWFKIDTAWKARGGKENIKRIYILTPILFKLGMAEAWNKALARENRM